MDPSIEQQQTPSKRFSKVNLAAIFLTLLGIGLFVYLVYAVGFREIVDRVLRFGVAGFAVILSIYFLRVLARAYAWKLCVYGPHSLNLRDTIPAVVIGEAMSSTIPLGILISGTSKAVAVRKRIPLVAGLSSVATENLFYSLVTSIYLLIGAVVLLRGFAVDQALMLTINALIVAVVIFLCLLILMVVRQWHLASGLSEWIYNRGFLTKIFEKGRSEVRRFEDFIFGFYRKHPRRFIPICLLESVFHCLGILEVWYILSRLTDADLGLLTSFLMESVSRLLTIIFKLIPFNIGVDEAGAQFVGETIGLAAGLGVTLAIVRKGRILFWTAIGWILIAKRGLTFKELSRSNRD